MNFIDRALAQGEGLTPDDFLQAMADIYKEPQVWRELDRYPQYIQDVIYIIDYDTEVQMEGLDGCAASPRVEQYIQALLNCGAAAEAEILKRAGELSGPDYEDEAVDAEMDILCQQIALNQDYDAFWDLVRGYIERSRGD
ncbi:hypothetical protein D1641_07930 [Colidextribacter sp. OB.20]|uniref:DMP19 family protein n=1 Tax=Colidextribacter sp. OB.20 TaxID=2304568 RepID=UPI001368A61D|nr:hypothetical protein [Colidextribacter sp. OB.20]NBI09946.1 hypothetical protein [Colidextribacter sp. OB.20]